MSKIGAEQLSYGSSPPIMTFSENLISSPNEVSRSLPRIISYLPLLDLLTWHFHVTIFVALNSGYQNFTFILFEVVNLPASVYHIFFVTSFYLRFEVSLPVTIVELLLLPNRIQKFVNFALPLRVFIQPCRIGY